MNLRFIEYRGDIYVVIGITYDCRYRNPECFTAVPIDNFNKSVFKAALSLYTLNIPFAEAIEITDKNRLLSLMVLYG